MSAQILIIEDDEIVLDFLTKALTFNGFQVNTALNGRAGLVAVLETPPDLIIFDLNMPDQEGWEVFQKLRQRTKVPVVMLSGKHIRDIFETSGPEFRVKYFSPDELLERIKGLLEHSSPVLPNTYQFCDLLLDTGARQARRGDRMITLTGKEYEMLELFMRNARQVLTRELIYEEVWGYDFGGDSNIIEVYIRYLRRKLECSGEIRLIHTVRGMGYVLREHP